MRFKVIRFFEKVFNRHGKEFIIIRSGIASEKRLFAIVDAMHLNSPVADESVKGVVIKEVVFFVFYGVNNF